MFRLMEYPHPNVVAGIEPVCLHRGPVIVWFQMQYCQGGTLMDKALESGRLSFATCVHYMLHAAVGLAHCHQHGVFHFDVKPDNMLLDDEGVLKIADFGSASVVADNKPRVHRWFCKGNFGTREYQAPEIFEDGLCDAGAADVWSLGVCAYVLFVKYFLWNTASADDPSFSAWSSSPQTGLALQDIASLAGAVLPGAYADLLARMLAVKPAHRPTMVEVAKAFESLL